MQDDKLSELYQIRFSQEELPRKNAIWQVLCDNFFSRFISQHDTVIDIASGYGEFSNNIKAKRHIAIDLNPDAKGFLDNTVEFHLCEATRLGEIVQDEADVVFTSNFLEHLTDKRTLDELLDQVMISLKLGGKFMILGPNLRYLPGEYWDFYDHHLGLTHLSLCEALQLKGFKIDLCIDRFLPYTTQGALPTHPWLVWLYLKLPFIWRFFGKQFFIIAEK